MLFAGYTAALRQTPQYQGLARAYSTARSALMQLSHGDYKQLAEAANRRLMMALERLGLKDSYVLVVSKSKQLISDQFHDLVQRPEFQQIYVISNEIYQQVGHQPWLSQLRLLSVIRSGQVASHASAWVTLSHQVRSGS